MQVSLLSLNGILLFTLLAILSPTRARFMFTPQSRAQLKRAVDSCRFKCSQLSTSENIKNPVAKDLVMDFGQIMKTVLWSSTKVFGLGVYLHALVASSGMFNALYWAKGDEISRPDREAPPPIQSVVSTQTKETSAVLGAVLTMYSTGCVDKDSFSPNVTFEDPTGQCKGIGEVKNTFNALKAVSPETLDWELGNVTDDKVEVHLWQRYKILNGSKDFDLFEKVVVQHDKGKITSMEDLWRGKPLRHYPPFTWCRRLNGVMTEYLNSHFNRNNSRNGLSWVPRVYFPKT